MSRTSRVCSWSQQVCNLPRHDNQTLHVYTVVQQWVPLHGAILSRFSCPFSTTSSQKETLRGAGWTYGLATLVCAPSPQKHISYSPFTRYGPLSVAVGLAHSRVAVLRNTS